MRRRKKKADETEASAEAPPQESETAEAPPRPGVAWGNVIHDRLTIDNPAEVAKRLRQELSLGEERTSYGAVLHALDRSARNLDDAGRLYRAAKTEEERYRLETDEKLGAMWEAASAELQAEYKRKERRSPQNSDIEGRVRESWPDAYQTIKAQRAELHQAVQSLETLVSAWSSRCADLRILAERVRPH